MNDAAHQVNRNPPCLTATFEQLRQTFDPDRCYALFLDIDGTLAEFQFNPEHSFIASQTLRLISQLQLQNIAVCMVTGRSLEQAERMLTPLKLPIAATHGLEIKISPDTLISHSPKTCAIEAVKLAVYKASCHLPQLYIENKPHSVALHYRQYPHLAPDAERIMRKVAANFPMWQLQQGKCVWELVPKGHDKGSGIMSLIKHLNLEHCCPVFIGDDYSDEAGFAVMRNLGGIGIKVGLGETQAHFQLADIAAVTQFLDAFLKFCTFSSLSTHME